MLILQTLSLTASSPWLARWASPINVEPDGRDGSSANITGDLNFFVVITDESPGWAPELAGEELFGNHGQLEHAHLNSEHIHPREVGTENQLVMSRVRALYFNVRANAPGV